MKATVDWQEDMTFVGTPDSGFAIQMDAEPVLGGSNQGVRPMELIALGLGGCTAMDVISILRKKRQQVTGFEVRVDAPRSFEHPKVITRAELRYIVTGKNIDEAAVLRAIELSSTKYCPAQIMLGQAFPIDLHYEIYEDEGENNLRLVSQGTWQNLSAV